MVSAVQGPLALKLGLVAACATIHDSEGMLTVVSPRAIDIVLARNQQVPCACQAVSCGRGQQELGVAMRSVSSAMQGCSDCTACKLTTRVPCAIHPAHVSAYTGSVGRVVAMFECALRQMLEHAPSLGPRPGRDTAWSTRLKRAAMYAAMSMRTS